MSAHTQRLVCIVGVLPFAVAAAGCTEQTAAEESFARQRLTGVTRDQAFEASRAAFRQYFSIQQADELRGTLVSRPADLTDRSEPTRVRDVLTTTPNRRRQIAEMHVTPQGADVIVACRIRVQRLDTSERRAFAPQTGDDRPAANPPFERESGATPAQREDWVDAGRNRSLERQVLESVRERLEVAATQPAASP